MLSCSQVGKTYSTERGAIDAVRAIDLEVPRGEFLAIVGRSGSGKSSLMAMIGVNLAVLNLLPIPPLDGGHILFLFIEGTMRRDLSVRVKERFVTVSMVFLLLVFAIVMYNDVLRLIPHH